MYSFRQNLEPGTLLGSRGFKSEQETVPVLKELELVKEKEKQIITIGYICISYLLLHNNPCNGLNGDPQKDISMSAVD